MAENSIGHWLGPGYNHHGMEAKTKITQTFAATAGVLQQCGSRVYCAHVRDMYKTLGFVRIAAETPEKVVRRSSTHPILVSMAGNMQTQQTHPRFARAEHYSNRQFKL